MANTLGFLFQGQPPASTTQYGQSTSNVPPWLQQYNQGILASATALAGQPYQPYSGPRIAGFTPAQLQAQQQVQSLQGNYLPTLNNATQLAQSGSSSPAIGQGLGYLGNAATGVTNTLGTFGSNFNPSYGYLGSAQGLIGNALNPTSLMNPYEQNVINQAKVQGQQYWQNTLQPSIQNQFTANGQFGSSADLLAQDQAANQLAENIQATAGAQLASGYTTAQQAALAAAGQTAGLGQLQGNLAATQAGVGMQGAQAQGQLGQIAGGLGYEGGVLGLQGASQLGSLAQEGQALGLQGAGALDTTGLEQQQLNQQNLSLGYQDFLNQQAYPYQQLGWLGSMVGGMANPNMVPYTNTTAGTGYAPAYSASPFAQAMGLYNMYGTPARKGGSIRRPTKSRGYLPERRVA